MIGRDSFTRYYAPFLVNAYDVVDRIVTNAYFGMACSPGRFRKWWYELHGTFDNLDDTHLMRMAGRFSRRVPCPRGAWAWALALAHRRVLAGTRGSSGSEPSRVVGSSTRRFLHENAGVGSFDPTYICVTLRLTPRLRLGFGLGRPGQSPGATTTAARGAGWRPVRGPGGTRSAGGKPAATFVRCRVRPLRLTRRRPVPHNSTG